MVKLDEKYVKKYFRKEGTVSEWWDPEEELNDKIRYIHISERRDVVELIEPKDKVILDCGTGKGRIAIELAKEEAKLVVGSDISKEMLEIAKERAKEENVVDRIIFEEGDAEDLKYPDNYFDAAVCLQTLMHIPNPEKCINELARVVKSGGVVVADHINRNPLWRIRIMGWKNFFQTGIIRNCLFSSIMYPFRKFLYKFGFHQLNPIVKRTSKQGFLNLFSQANEIAVIKNMEYGPTYCPVYFLCYAIKRGKH